MRVISLQTLIAVGSLLGASATDPAISDRSATGRLWQSSLYALMNVNVDVNTFASAIANFTPTYVSGVLRLAPHFQMTQEMVSVPRYNVFLTSFQIDDYNTVRTAVLAKSPNAKLDVELNLDPNATQQTQNPYT